MYGFLKRLLSFKYPIYCVSDTFLFPQNDLRVQLKQHSVNTVIVNNHLNIFLSKTRVRLLVYQNSIWNILMSGAS